MNITQVEPETLEALNEQVAELDRPMTEVPWWEFDPAASATPVIATLLSLRICHVSINNEG